MDVHSLAGAASRIAADLRRHTASVVENLHDPALLGNLELEGSIELLVDRLCLSIQLAKPVGLSTWAARESRRLGAAGALEVADAAAQVIASEAGKYILDQGRLLAFLEVLKEHIRAAAGASSLPHAASRYSESTLSLLAMLGARSEAVCSHSTATAEWARRLCGRLGLSEEATAFVDLCAVLHDVGKSATPDEILLKPGPLTAAEWEIMQDHSVAGQRILDQIPTLARCGVVVRSHHERWDGLGYPDGLAGESIPLEARIIAVADAFNAMISERPYRKAIGPRRALEILQSGAGTVWEPRIVTAMLALFEWSHQPLARAVPSTA